MVLPCGEVDEIPDRAVLWRRVRDHEDDLMWDSDSECWRPNLPPSNALQFDPDLSTLWQEHLVGHGHGPESALDAAGKYSLVFAVRAGAPRLAGCAVAHSPLENQPPLCGHASVFMPKPITKDRRMEIRYAISRAMELVYGEATIEPPPGA